ncbi:ROK family transcriptional regulator [Saccharopolyspora mangrovi]|uniref:ROK family protein n=1 Tax=Saccharopolyspora mangrovi TaxID=3082379 RepID=A0ABU6AIQ9_9PSEU|nr:ROK family protein [Saccharopolyspora sp. S2-29]MEB3371454.1 ROK family protein [Saccharopolyspora sp. S2-29]
MPTRAEDLTSAGHLLWLVRTGRARTRAELQQVTGLSRSTVGQRLDALLSRGFLRPTGVDSSTGGRPPVRLDFNHEHGVVLAADFGATHARTAVFDLAGRALAEEVEEIDIADGPEDVLNWADRRFRDLLDQAGRSPEEVRGIGLGVPGPVEFDAGVVRQPPIMPGWDGYPIAENLRARWDVPVLVDNDANVMAIGERTARFPDSTSLVLVKVATGIGAGMVLGGEVYRGVDGGAGDLGHVRVGDASQAQCMCGSTGCLAALASGSALARRLDAAGVPTASSREFAARVREGQPEAVRLAREAGQLIGEVLSTVVCLVNPQVLVLAGDLAEAQFVSGLREVLYQRALPRATRNLLVTTTELGDRAGILGVHTMIIDSVYSPASVDVLLAAG